MMKKCPAQNETNIDAIDVQSEVIPMRSFFGKSIATSFSWNLDVSIERNKTRAVTEEHSATSDATAKTLKAGCPLNTGTPVTSLAPPGIAVEVVNATVATSAATSEHDSEVLDSHFLPSLTSGS